MNSVQRATFGAGCFWGAEQYLRTIDGVIDSRVGFARPVDDDQLLIEVVQIDFEPTHVSFTELLEHFWQIHDPTSIDRQGADVGVKYRSAVFFHNEEQQHQANASRQLLDLSGTLKAPVVTAILEFGEFYLASEDQQRYLEKNGGTCSIK